MSEFIVNLAAINPKEEDRRTPPVEALVDTGSHSSWLPRQLLLDTGITPRHKDQFEMANGYIIERDIGYAILSANVKGEDYTMNGEVVFAEDGDGTILGVHTIEGFCVMVDNVNQRFVPVTARNPSNRALRGAGRASTSHPS